MSIGAGVVLFVIGAILRFALDIQVAWINIQLVGNILMGAGVVVFILGLIFVFRRRQSSSRTVVRPTDGDGVVRHTDRTDDTGL